MTSDVSRREVLALVLTAPVWAAMSATARAQERLPLDRHTFADARTTVVPAAGSANVDKVSVTRDWKGALCTSRVTNTGRDLVSIQEIVLFDVPLALPQATELYGEGFQMLSQTGGTLGAPADFASYTDAKHYRMPIPAGARAFYGTMALAPPGEHSTVLAFTSCRRFSGQFRVREGSLQVLVDTEGMQLGPGESWELEEFTVRSGERRELLMAEVAARLSELHPPLRTAAPPTGWCSWYCFGPKVTAKQVLDNLDVISKEIPGLKYIQIDDGYQPAMGDWLETGAAFGGDVQTVLKRIRDRGFEPAIWVAPFIAEEQSHVFQQHRDWFVRDSEGAPLRADRVTFGGWRRAPWYALDGTHPEVQRHFTSLFRTMRREWGCTYFKLDANFWGAIHGGRFHDRRATRIEAYRRGMQAIIEGAGDGFILGCNHPIWPSLGLLHGSRSSNDIKRTWERVASTARQNLSRNWQNGTLWWNDPDAVVLDGPLTDDEFQFHATVIYASGGMVLSGDDLTAMPPQRLAMLRKLLPPSGVAAAFEDSTLRVGVTVLREARVVSVFNWGDEVRSASFRLPRAARVRDFWTSEDLGRHEGDFAVKSMPPHSARLFVCT